MSDATMRFVARQRREKEKEKMLRQPRRKSKKLKPKVCNGLFLIERVRCSGFVSTSSVEDSEDLKWLLALTAKTLVIKT